MISMAVRIEGNYMLLELQMRVFIAQKCDWNDVSYDI